MPYPKHDEKVRKEALRLYSNVGLNEAARRLEGICSRNTIQRWAKDSDAKPPTLEQRSKRHLNRRNIYLKARRIKLNDKLFARAEQLLREKGKRISVAELKGLAVTYAILTDKRRLEEGEGAFAPAEQVTPEQIYEDGKLRMLRMEQKYDEHGNRTRGRAGRAALVSDIEEERRSRRSHNGSGQ